MTTAFLILLAVCVVVALAFVLSEILDFSLLGVFFFCTGTVGDLFKLLGMLVVAIIEGLTGSSEGSA